MYYYPQSQQYNYPGMYNIPGYFYTQQQQYNQGMIYGMPNYNQQGMTYQQQPQIQSFNGMNTVYQQQYPNGPKILPVGFGGNPNNGVLNSGGYYTGQYNNFNPYTVQQQQEEQLRRIQEQENYQINLMKTLYRSTCAYNGIRPTEEGLAYYDRYRTITQQPQNEVDLSGLTNEQISTYYQISARESIETQQQQAVERVGALMDQGRAIQGNPAILQAAYNNAKAFEDRQKKVPPDIGLMEYLENYAVDDYYEAKKLEMKKTHNTSALYNQDDYRSLLERHKSSLFGPALDPNSNIDDQEIRLPSHITEKQKQERRNRFIQTILAQGGV